MARKEHARIALRISLVAIFAYVLFMSLYRWDNKYTAKGPQPINGILSVSNGEWDQKSILYLVRDWEFYPDELLTPEDFQEQSGEHYKKFVSIGDSKVMDHGSGTYRLILDLPAESGTYALQLPEIFSAYNLYIGEKLYLQMGDNRPESYQPCIQNRVITFQGEGYVSLVLAVTDESHIYSGMTYPISLGSTMAINRSRGVRLFGRIVIFTIALIVMAMSVFLGIQSKKRENLLFALLSILLVGYTFYPIIHSFFQTGIHPWYDLELFCYYGMLLVVVSLYNFLTDVSIGTIRIVEITLLLLFVLIFILMGLISIGGYTELKHELTILVKLLKGGVGAYLLGSSIRTAILQLDSREWILNASSFFGFSIIADQLLPLYEPVFGGWFVEIGGSVLIITIGYLILKELADSYRFQLTYEEHARQTERMLENQRAHYEQLKEKIQETRTLRHDMRQHMRMLRSFLENECYDDMRKYLEKYEEERDTLSQPFIYCENLAVDSVLQYYAGIARKKGIPIEISGTLPEYLGIQDIDICPLLGNLMENAVEAVLRQPEGEKSFIHLVFHVKGNKIIIQLENTYSGKIKEKDGRFQSTKHSGQGIGIESVRKIAEQYGGFADFSMEQGIFHVGVFLTVDLKNN